MGRYAHIENRYIRIDTPAWLAQRTGGTVAELTYDLLTWATAGRSDRRGLGDPAPRFSPGGPQGVGEPSAFPSGWWVDAVQAWCRHRRHTSADVRDPGAVPLQISHVGTRLDTEIWIARSVDPDCGPIAVVQVNEEPPVVYADDVTDSADWYDADTVDIVCPNGHGWTWRTGRELIDAQGRFASLSVVFGPDLDAPFTRCPTCLPRNGRRPNPCGCDRRSWILCPLCGSRCDVELTEH